MDDLNQCLFTTESILKIFENINLDVLKKGLQDSTQAPTFSANMSQFKQRLIALIDKIIAKNVTEKDFLETSDPESNQILNVPDKWKDLAVFKEFQTLFASMMKQLAAKQTQIETLKREIEKLQETLPKPKSEPIQAPILNKSVIPQTVSYVRQDNSSKLANLWHSLSRKVHDFALIIWQQLIRAWNWLAS